MRGIIKTVVVAILMTLTVIVLLQNFLIFPGITDTIAYPPTRTSPSGGAEGIWLTASDGVKLEAWRLQKPAAPAENDVIALIFHGNLGDLEHFFYSQQYFQAAGITSYSIDYRGYGKSGGFPTEGGIYRDAEALWDYVAAREKLPPGKIILFGISIGTGPAAYLAEKYNTKVLTLIAPYSSVPNAVSDRRILGVLAPFVWIKFPNIDRMERLRDTCVVAAHGKLDVKILPYHTKLLEEAYRGKGGFFPIVEAEADHNNIIQAAWPRIEAAMRGCLSR